MQRIVEAEQSDLFDVLAYVAFAMEPLSREVRAEHARDARPQRCNEGRRSAGLRQYEAISVLGRVQAARQRPYLWMQSVSG